MHESTASRALLIGALFAGCATQSVDPRPDHERARFLIREATGRSEIFDPDAPLLSQTEIDAVMEDGLTLDEALRVALLNNRHLQAQFLGLGVARADLVQAGLLRNPSLSLGFLFPTSGGQPKITADLIGSIADLWQLPDRQKVADMALAKAVYEVSRSAGELVVQTESAYFDSVAARALLDHARASADVNRAMHEAVSERVRAGVATATDANLAQSQLLGAELAARRAEFADVGAKRRLATALSLEQDLVSVELTDPLPELITLELDREGLVTRARATRLDVRAAEASIQAADAQVAFERRRVWPSLDVGLSAEQPEADSPIDLLIGPSATAVLPIFDRNTAQIRRAEFRRDQLRKEYEALAADVGQEVRTAVDHAVSAALSARFVTDELLPQAERTAELARTAYELGSTTSLALLESQRVALLGRQHRIEVLLEAARARVELERAAGASLEMLARENSPPADVDAHP